MLGAGWLVSRVTDSLALGAIADTSVRILLFVLLVVANRELLARHWKAFCAAPWRSVGLVLVGLVAIQVVISLVGTALRPLASDVDAAPIRPCRYSSRSCSSPR